MAGNVVDKIDHLCTRIDALLEAQNDNNRITVTHTQGSNAGFYMGVSVTACVAAVALVIGFMIVENRSYAHLDAQIDQLKAWSEIHGREITLLKAQKPKE